jgi:hypothetical protein
VLYSVGYSGFYWSVTPVSSSSYNAFYLYFYYFGTVHPSDSYNRSHGSSVRCLKE